MTLRTLIIDDDIEFLKDVKTCFSSEIELHTAHSAKEAEDLIQKYKNWDIIVFDILLPDKNGLELYRQYKSLEKSTTLILLTHLQDDPTFDRAISLVPDDFIMKPIPIQRLERLIINRHKKKQSRSSIFTLGDVHIDLANGSLRRGDKHVDLTKKEWAILSKIIDSDDLKVQKEDLTGHLSIEYQISRESLNTHMSNLRKKLSQVGIKIFTTESLVVCLEKV